MYFFSTSRFESSRTLESRKIWGGLSSLHQVPGGLILDSDLAVLPPSDRGHVFNVLINFLFKLTACLNQAET